MAYINGRTLVDGELRDGLTVEVEGGLIRAIKPSSEIEPKDVRQIDLGGNWLLPGFIDVQVNGGGGVLFNDDPSVDGIECIAAAHRRFGTTGLLPTLISDKLEVIQRGLAATRSAIIQGVPGIIGIHIEGPFLCPEKRGVHDADRMITPDWETLRRLEPLDNGVTLITLAPDRVGPGMIRDLVERGFIVSAGHSNATYAQVRTAVAEGLRGFTHLYNAMSQLTAREPGMVGAALTLHETFCGLIADGHHVAAAAIDTAWRCKGSGRLLLVTDAMPNAGTDLDEFVLQGRRIVVRDGVCQDEQGTLAGASLTLGEAARNMMRITGCPLGEAIAMASQTPADFLNLSHERGAIAVGKRADLVVTDPKLNVLQTYLAGQPA